MNLFVIIQTIKRSADDLILVDPYGIGLTIISVTIVFIVLISLYLIFRIIGLIFHKLTINNQLKQNELSASKSKDKIMGEECAAIAMAIYYMQSQNHDEEAHIITIKKKNYEYSPWNSKIYGLRKKLK